MSLDVKDCGIPRSMNRTGAWGNDILELRINRRI